MNDLQEQIIKYIDEAFSSSIKYIDFEDIKEIIDNFYKKNSSFGSQVINKKSYEYVKNYFENKTEDRKYKVKVKNIVSFVMYINNTENPEDFKNFKQKELFGYLNNKIIFFDKINLYKFTFNKDRFNECEFKEDVILREGDFRKDLIFKNCVFKKKLVFKKCKFNGKLEIKDCNNNLGGKLKGDVKLININDLELLTIRGCNFNSIELKHVFMENKSGTFLFYSLDVSNFFYTGSSKLPETISFSDIKIYNLLKFHFINLGKSIFNSITINKLYLENTTLNECVFNGVEFKDYKLKEGKLSNKQLKDNYRQLKFVMDKNRNYTEGNKFYEKEMDYYERELSEKGLSQEKIVLYFQKWISYYGKSWFAPIGWIVILVFITDIINYSYIANFFDCKDGFICKSIEFWKLFWNLLYPLYGLKKDYIDGLDNWLTFGFILYKTIYGILLWHLVIALKRTTKR